MLQAKRVLEHKLSDSEAIELQRMTTTLASRRYRDKKLKSIGEEKPTTDKPKEEPELKALKARIEELEKALSDA